MDLNVSAAATVQSKHIDRSRPKKKYSSTKGKSYLLVYFAMHTNNSVPIQL